ncbi:MAG: M23 family metallopeptidase [Chloroflexota bacterium]
MYGHMSSRSVSCGQDVSAGSIIGSVGNTGNSSGPHLHFEIRVNDQPQDPTTVLPF